MTRSAPLLSLLLAACGPTKAAVDTGTPGGDSGDSATTDSAETADSGDSAETADSGETADTADSADSALPLCDLSDSGSVHIDEGESGTLTFLCDGVVPADTPLLSDDLPAGAVLDAAAWTITWTPGLDQAGEYPIHVYTAEGATDKAKFWVSDAWYEDDNVAVDPLTYEKEDGLPVFHLTTDSALNSSYDTPATLVYEGHTFTIGAQTRGASSLYYPQQSLALKFDEADKFDDDEDGWGKAEDLTLMTTFDDNSYIRNVFTYWLWGQLDPDNLTIRTFMGVLYLNGKYWGLYEVQERVNDEFFEHRGLNHDGSLYKGISHDANFYRTDVYGNGKYSLSQGYEKENGSPAYGEPGYDADINALVSWAYSSSDADFADQLSTKIVDHEVWDWFILVTFAGGWDSGGKNALLYYDSETDGPWRFTPWDFNASWGQNWETSRVAASAWDDFTWTNNLFNRSLNDDTLSAALWTRYRADLEGPLDAETLVAKATELEDEISPAADRSWVRWSSKYESYSGWASTRNYYGDWTTPEEERAYLYAWIRDRWDTADAAVTAAGY